MDVTNLTARMIDIMRLLDPSVNASEQVQLKFDQDVIEIMNTSPDFRGALYATVMLASGPDRGATGAPSVH